jgi:hypothetical protein
VKRHLRQHDRQVRVGLLGQPNCVREARLELAAVEQPGLLVAGRELGQPTLAAVARRDVADSHEVTAGSGAVVDGPPGDEDPNAVAAAMAERELGDELAARFELGVPRLDLVPVLRRPERERSLLTEQLLPVEAEQVAESAVDGADPPVPDDHQTVGECRQERSGRIPFAV